MTSWRRPWPSWRPSWCGSTGLPFEERIRHLPLFLPPFVALAGLVYWFFQLYRSKWRFASLPDLFNIFRASSVLALMLLIVDYLLVSPQLFGFFFFGKITIALYWLVQMFLLGGPRLAFRYLKFARSRHTLERDGNTPTLLLGRGERHRGGAARDRVRHRAQAPAARHPVVPAPTISASRSAACPCSATFGDLDQVVQDFQRARRRDPAPRRDARARSRPRRIPTC